MRKYRNFVSSTLTEEFTKQLPIFSSCWFFTIISIYEDKGQRELISISFYTIESPSKV